MGSSRRLRRVFALLLSVSLVTIAAGTASAAPSKPTVKIDDQGVTGTTFQVDLVVNRGAKQIASCSYVVDSGATVACGTKRSTAKSTTYLVSIVDQSVGAHTVTFTVVLTDGGRGTVSTSFAIAAPPALVFARAWGDVDEVAGYGPSIDTLFSELVDTNGSGAPDAGDTVHTYLLPSDFTGSTVAVTFERQSVRGVAYGDGVILATAERGDFWWEVVDGSFDAYSENGASQVSAFDWHTSGSPQYDHIWLEPGSPSGPVTPDLHQLASLAGDDGWLEIALDVTGL